MELLIGAMLTPTGFVTEAYLLLDLYDAQPARKPGQRGRNRIYGEKYTPKRIAHLKRTTTTLRLYGKEQAVRYRSQQVKARFLGGQMVRVVWCEFLNESCKWKAPCLLLSTNVALSPETIIESYGLHWPIESMFHQLKQAWGLKDAWQQTRQTLHRWVHITIAGYGWLILIFKGKKQRNFSPVSAFSTAPPDPDQRRQQFFPPKTALPEIRE